MFSANILFAEEADCFEFDENFNVNKYSLPVFEKIICSESTEKIIDIHSNNLVTQNNKYWWILIFIFGLVVALWNIQRVHILQLLKSITSLNYLNQLSRNEKGSEKMAGFIFLLLFNLVISLSFQGVFFVIFDMNANWWFLALTFFTFTLYENVVHSTAGFLLKLNQLVTAQRLNTDGLMFVGVVLFLPLTFLMFFSCQVIAVLSAWFFLGSFVFIILLKEFRSLQLVNSHRIKIVNFYFFVYLCTFKILPVLFMVKILDRYIINSL